MQTFLSLFSRRRKGIPCYRVKFPSRFGSRECRSLMKSLTICDSRKSCRRRLTRLTSSAQGQPMKGTQVSGSTRSEVTQDQSPRQCSRHQEVISRTFNLDHILNLLHRYRLLASRQNLVVLVPTFHVLKLAQINAEDSCSFPSVSGLHSAHTCKSIKL